MTTTPGSVSGYLAASAGGGVNVWLTTAQSWLAVMAGILTIAVLAVRLYLDWPKVIERFRRKGGG